MDKPEDHGGGDVNNPFCKYCTDEKGNLLPREQVRAKMIQFYIQKQSKTQEEAEKLTDQLMAEMPAWKGEGGGVVPEEKPVPAEPIPTPEPLTPQPKPTTEPTIEPSAPEPTAEPAPEQPTETPTEQVKPEGETPSE